MALTLKNCFAYVGMDESPINEESIAEVRKILLLELKSSVDDTVLISGVRYNKQDIVSFFTAEFGLGLLNHGDDWHERFASPAKIEEWFELTDVLLDNEQLESIQALIEEKYGNAIVRDAQRLFRDGDFEQLLILCSYEFVFADHLLFRLKRALALQMRTLVRQAQMESASQSVEEVRASPFFKKSFYQLVSFLMDADDDLTTQIVQVAVNYSRDQQYLTWREKRQFFDLVLLMPLSEHLTAFVNNWQRYLDQFVVMGLAPGTKAFAEKKLMGSAFRRWYLRFPRNLRIGIAATIIISFSALTRWANPGSVFVEPAVYAPEYASEQESVPDAQFVRDHYPRLKGTLEARVKNRHIRDFLLNELSLLANDTLLDSSKFELKFDFMSENDGIDVKYTTNCAMLNVLVLIYNEDRPDERPRGIFLRHNASEMTYAIQVQEGDRILTVFNPQMKDDYTVLASRIPSINTYHSLFKSYGLNAGESDRDQEFIIRASEMDGESVNVENVLSTLKVFRLCPRY